MTAQRPVDVLVRVLTERGPMTEDALVAETGVDFDAAIEEGDGLLTMLADDRWGVLPVLLDGRVLTHRVTAEELASDALAQHPDLPVFGELVDTHGRLSDGTVLGTDVDGDLWLTFPAGYLRSRGVGEGTLVTFGLTYDGLRLEVIDADALTEPADLGAALRATLETHGEPIELDIAVPSVCANDPLVLRTPHAPFTELLPRLGFAVHGEWLAEEGFDFAERRVELQAGRIAELHRLEPHEARAVGALVDGYRELADGRALGEPDSLREVLGLLADPGVAAAVLAETIGGHSRDPAALRSLAETYEPRASHAARVGLRWLRAKATERLGAVAEAETELHAAVTLDPNWPLALEDLARYESDRGDANRTLALLHRGGVEAGDELLELLAPFESTPRTDIGRNEPCWCGSGRKYKKCHLNKAEFALPERAGWLKSPRSSPARDSPPATRGPATGTKSRLHPAPSRRGPDPPR